MKITTKTLNSSILFLVLGLSLGSFFAETALGQRGGKRAKNAVKNKVRNHATTQGKNRARNVYQNHGKNIVKQKALQNGVTKQQVLNNRNRAKNWAKNSITNRAQSRTNNWLQNNGRDFAKKQIKGKTVGMAKDKAKDIYRNHGKQIVKNYAQQNGYTKQQVLNHQNQVKNRLKHGIKSRAKNAVQNHGKDYAKNRLQQYGKQQVRNHLKGKVKDKVKGRVHNYVSHRKHWHWHQGHTFGKNSWKRLFGRASYLRAHRSYQWTFQQWQQCFPSQCGWWYGYCGTDFYFDPSCTTSFDWACYQVPVALVGVVNNPDVKWNLGLQCILIPGKGLGVEEVAAGSPAELAGLEPGMIILTANGIPIVDEVAFPSAIDSSDGTLELEVQISETETASTTVQMQPIQLMNF